MKSRARSLRLSTKLIVTYSLVALLAVVMAGLVALPLLEGYQNERIDQERQRKALEYGGNLDALRLLISNQQSERNPFKEYLVTNPRAHAQQRVWPPTPSLDTVRQKFNDLAQERGLRIIAITERDRVVRVDTESDPATTLQGQELASITPNAAPTPPPAGAVRTLPIPPEITIVSKSGRQYSLYYLPVRGDSAPNLFGLNPRQRPLEFFVAVVVPAIPAPAVWQDLVVILGAAALASLLLSLLIGFWLARSLSRPLVRLTEATHAVAQGDYEQQVAPEGGYELVRLAESFNRMTRNVAEAQRMQRQLIANVSHELKTPLTSIQGFSQAMLDGVLRRPEDFRRPAEIIANESARMIRLVSSLLELSRLESGQAALKLAEVDMAALARQATESFAARAGLAGVELVWQGRSPLPVMADADRLIQVMNNLIDNALKHTPPGGSIHLTAFEAGGRALVRVSDTGAGIPTADLPFIFERFYQADKSRRRDQSHEGTGLGLAICKEIITAHGGKLEVSSREGQGTQFTISLPALPARAVVKQTTAPLKRSTGEFINK